MSSPIDGTFILAANQTSFLPNAISCYKMKDILIANLCLQALAVCSNLPCLLYLQLRFHYRHGDYKELELIVNQKCSPFHY